MTTTIEPVSLSAMTPDAVPEVPRWRSPEVTISKVPGLLSDLELKIETLETRLASADRAYTVATTDENPDVRSARIAQHQPGYAATRAELAKEAEGIRRQLATLADVMRPGGLWLEDEAELNRANALLPSVTVEVGRMSFADLATQMQTAIFNEDRSLQFALAVTLPGRLAGVNDNALNRAERAAANDLRGLVAEVRAGLQDRRGLKHAERTRELRNRAETIKRNAGGGDSLPPAPWKGENDVSWGR